MVRPAAGPGRAGLRAEGSVRNGAGAVPRAEELRAPSRADPALPCAGTVMAPPRKGDLSAEEKDLLAVIATGNTEEAGRLLGSKNVRVNCLDELYNFIRITGKFWECVWFNLQLKAASALGSEEIALSFDLSGLVNL